MRKMNESDPDQWYKTASMCVCVAPHLVSPEVVDHHHAGQVQHHAQTLEGGHGEPQSTVLLHQAGGVVPAVGAAFAARQALIGHVGSLVSARASLFTWGRESAPVDSQISTCCIDQHAACSCRVSPKQRIKRSRLVICYLRSDSLERFQGLSL